MTSTRGSSNADKSVGVPSSDASSTTTSSRSDSVCRRTLAIEVSTYGMPLCTARSTETSGGSGDSIDASVRRVTSFDLVVATVGRTDALDNLLGSLEGQTHRGYRVLVVDQNDDERVARVLARHPSLRTERHRSAPGLSHARNAALPHLRAEVAAFPDDDCTYPNGLLARVAARLDAEPQLDGLTGRDDRGAWPDAPAVLTRTNLWNRAISFTIFLRRSIVTRVGAFDERLGLPESSGEEIDYLIRAIDLGARIEYDPSIVVHHEATARPLAQLGARDGASIGYLLRKHRYPRRRVAPMLVRPAAGVLLSALRNDRARPRFHASTLRGRLSGYRGVGAAPQ